MVKFWDSIPDNLRDWVSRKMNDSGIFFLPFPPPPNLPLFYPCRLIKSKCSNLLRRLNSKSSSRPRLPLQESMSTFPLKDSPRRLFPSSILTTRLMWTAPARDAKPSVMFTRTDVSPSCFARSWRCRASCASSAWARWSSGIIPSSNP